MTGWRSRLRGASSVLLVVLASLTAFERGGNAVFDIADAGTVVSSALRTLAPRIASEIPRHTDVIIATLRKRSFATETLRFADTVRVLGLVLPPVAIALFVLAVAVAP